MIFLITFLYTNMSVYDCITGLKICHWQKLLAYTQQSSQKFFFLLLHS